MGKYTKELAEMLGAKQGGPAIQIAVGEIISVDPIRVHYGDKVILSSRQLYFSDSLLNGYEAEYEDTTTNGPVKRKVIIKNELKIGDELMMIPTSDLGAWYVIDKVASS